MSKNVTLKLSLLVALLLFVTGLVTSAQNPTPSPTPRYEAKILSWGETETGNNIRIEFQVVNTGGPAVLDVRADVVVIQDGRNRVVSNATIRPLDDNPPENTETLVMTAPVSSFDPGSVQVFQVLLVTPPNWQGIVVDSPTVSIPIPQPGATETTDEPEPFFIELPLVIDIPLLGRLDFSNPDAYLVMAMIIATITLTIWILITLLRWIFRTSPSFGNWQPPYGVMPHIDPNSVAGIRQAWQQHAQTNVIHSACAPEATYACKYLTGVDGSYLDGWQVIAMRLTLYDQYGRIASKQTLAPSTAVNQINRLVRRRQKLSHKQVSRRVRRTAKSLTNRFWKYISPRVSPLPIAFDIRLRGKHGEVDIRFELYQCQNGHWVSLDGWQPDMRVVNNVIYEAYTYTIFGIQPGENMRQYKKRIRSDIERLLVDFVGVFPEVEHDAQTSRGESPESPPETDAAGHIRRNESGEGDSENYAETRHTPTVGY